jgi:predicted nucleic acid-binding Zn ribbon protein
MSMADRLRKMMEDPVKRGKLFKLIWMSSYGMLMLGIIIIVWVLYAEKFLG